MGEDEWTFDFTFAGDGVGGLAQAGETVTSGRTRSGWSTRPGRS
jgi:hypothetical protein